MNPRVRTRRVRVDTKTRALLDRLDAFTARVRVEEARWLAGRPGFDPRDPGAAVAALVAGARAALSTRRRVHDRADTLRALVAGTDGLARREALARHVRVTVPGLFARWGDLAALGRDLDLDALLEREAAAAEREGARVEVAVRALAAWAKELSPADWERVGAGALLLDVAVREPRPPTRRAAVRALARTTAEALGRGETPEPRALRTLRALVRGEEEDPWVRRAALEVTLGLPEGEARAWLDEAARVEEGLEPFLLRARAVELALRRPGPFGPALAEARLGDPSELVRVSLVEGLLPRLGGEPEALRTYRRILREDPEPKLRARAVARLAEAAGRLPTPVVGELIAGRLHDTERVAAFALETATRLAREGWEAPDRLREVAAVLAGLSVEAAPPSTGSAEPGRAGAPGATEAAASADPGSPSPGRAVEARPGGPAHPDGSTAPTTVVPVEPAPADGAASAPSPTPAPTSSARAPSPRLEHAAALFLLTARVSRGPAWALATRLTALRPGERRVEPLPPGVDAGALADALAAWAADDWGFTLEPGPGHAVTVTRGDTLRPALWRVLHELRNPGPAKRQGHSHALGTADTGGLRVPPGGLAEESPTGVPGQRVLVERQGGWAPAVPRVDDYLDALSRGVVTLVTPEGTTRVRAPRRAWDRLRARARLVFGYGRFDTLRLSSLDDPDPSLRHRYVEGMGALGFETEEPPRGVPHGGSARAGGAGGARGAGGTMRAGGGTAHSFVGPLTFLAGTRYTSLGHLAVVVAILLTWLFGQAAWARAQVRAARAKLPIVLGGWGTRGKSGTERLKAAVMEGLGVPMVSKTTGCEAMILHAPPGGHALELFLFRPYDKATIWEQVQVVRLAAKLGARAFLWECMGLNPTYVNLLQAGWMRDDLSTLTNAYPDHEDIQGPTGMDVAEVIGGFASPDGLVLTTEANMRPVLAEQARLRGATLETVGRVERELVPADLLDRMPHAEHPANVALAAAAAGALGVDPVEAVGLMAEHVVSDLGALIITPPVRHMGRELVFANGMSANDTLSFRHNWRRTGFAAHEHLAEPGTWLVTVVNNRADRVARTKVFARILANDANAHRHVLIGTNLQGLRTYLREAVDARLADTVLDGDPARVDALFAHLRLVPPGPLGEACAARLGVPEEARRAWVVACEGLAGAFVPELGGARRVAERLRAAAVALEKGAGGAPEVAVAGAPVAFGRAGGGAEGLADALVEAAARWGAYEAARGAPAERVKELYRAIVEETVVVVADSGTSGDAIIGMIAASAPPGARVRVMGIQNIKGTGLDFAYQWVFWHELAGHLRQFGARDPERRRAALEGAERNPHGSVMACEATLAALPTLAADPALASRAAALAARLEERRTGLLQARRGGTVKRRGPLVRLLERILDPFDAILRKSRAVQVFADLAAMRISHPRAQAELKRLTERQKGGWLGKR